MIINLDKGFYIIELRRREFIVLIFCKYYRLFVGNGGIVRVLVVSREVVLNRKINICDFKKLGWNIGG